MKYFIGLLFLFFTSILNAQLPLDFKGHGEVDANIKKALRIEFPNRSVMQTADKRIYVDTDEDNLLYNGSLEAAVALNGLSYTGTGILTRNVGGTQYEGDVGYNYTSAGATPGNALSFAPVTLPAGWVTTPTTIEFSCWTNTIDPGAALELANGTGVLATVYTTATIPISSVYTRVSAIFTTSGQTVVYPRIKSTALGTSTNFDSCYVGRYKTVNSRITVPWTDYVPVLAVSSGTLPGYTLNYAKWSRDGENLSRKILITLTSVPTFSGLFISRPPNLTQAFSSVPISRVSVVDVSTGNEYAGRVFGTQLFMNGTGAGTPGAPLSNTSVAPLAAGDQILVEETEYGVQEWVGTNSQTVFNVNTPPNSVANVFSAKVSGAGVVSDESSDFINGNCAVASTNQFTCTFVGSLFSQTPNCVVSPGASVSSNMSDQLVTASTTSFRVDTFSANAANAHAWNVTCSRAGSDVKPNILFPAFSGSVKSTNVLPKTIISGGFGGATIGANCTTSPCTLRPHTDPGIASVTLGTTGLYTLNVVAGTCTQPLVCTFTAIANGTQYNFCGRGSNSTTTYVTQCLIGSTNTAANSEVDFNCTCN